MKTCPSCFSEFRDEAERCDACLVALVSEAEGARLRAAQPSPSGPNTSFAVATRSQDPFEAEALVAAIRALGVPVFSRSRAAVDVLVTSSMGPFWDILVPTDSVEQAREAIAKRRVELEAESADAERAAEAEALATENHVVVGESESETVAGQWAEQLAAAGIAAMLRTREDVELDSPGDEGPTVTLVMVPNDRAAEARALIQGDERP